MPEATLTSKGQVTIPAEIRRRMGLAAQDRVSFTAMPDGTVVLRAKTGSVLALKGMLQLAPGQTVPLDSMGFGRA